MKTFLRNIFIYLLLDNLPNLSGKYILFSLYCYQQSVKPGYSTEHQNFKASCKIETSVYISSAMCKVTKLLQERYLTSVGSLLIGVKHLFPLYTCNMSSCYLLRFWFTIICLPTQIFLFCTLLILQNQDKYLVNLPM